MSYAGKNAYYAGKTSGVLRGGASGANRGYVLGEGLLDVGINVQFRGRGQKGVSVGKIFTHFCFLVPRI